MQRKLIDDLVELELHVERISQHAQLCRQVLHSVLSAYDKNMEVIFNDKVYDFYLPTTEQEKAELAVLRHELIDKVMNAAFSTGNWDFVLAFASGVDPLDMQCEKVDLSDIYNVTDENGDVITALPLNEDAHVVKVQRLKEEDVQKD